MPPMNICLATVALVCVGAVLLTAGWDGLMRDPWCVLRVLGNPALTVVVPALLIGVPYLALKPRRPDIREARLIEPSNSASAPSHGSRLRHRSALRSLDCSAVSRR